MASSLLLALCFFVAITAAITPPDLPTAFYGKFTEFTAPKTASPPFKDGVPDAPFIASRGEVYYDWEKEAMIEKRLDYCVNIFPEGNNFTCIFHNVNKTSFLVTSAGSPFPPCCIFGQPWFPPPPDFLRVREVAMQKAKVAWDDFEAQWWEVPSIEPPTGPFWYAFRADNLTSPQVYLSFSFPGIEGWVQQNFFDISMEPPPSQIFGLPPECKNGEVPNCGFMGSQSIFQL